MTGDLDGDKDADSNDLLLFLAAWTGALDAQVIAAKFEDLQTPKPLNTSVDEFIAAEDGFDKPAIDVNAQGEAVAKPKASNYGRPSRLFVV